MSSITDNKIAPGEVTQVFVQRQDDRLHGTPTQNKKVFDEYPDLIRHKHNAALDAIDAKFALNDADIEALKQVDAGAASESARASAESASESAQTTSELLGRVISISNKIYTKSWDITESQSEFTFTATDYTYNDSDTYEVFVNGLKLGGDEFTQVNNVVTLNNAISSGNALEIIVTTNLKGKGIADTELNDDYTLTINYDDGTSMTTESIRGEQGEKGDKGDGIYDDTEVKTDIAVLESRVDSFTHLTEGSTTGDAELIDARIGYDGKTYSNAGDAVRGQVGDLTTDLEYIGLCSSTLDMSSYSTINAGMQSDGTWAGLGGTTFKSALVTGSYTAIDVTANSIGSTFISFFNKIPSEPTKTTSEIYFCDGETGRHQVSTGTTSTLTVPSDCVCIVVGVVINSTDRTPTIKGTSITSGEIEKIYDFVESEIDGVNDKIDDEIDIVYNGTKTYSKNEVLALEHISDGLLYSVTGVTVGVTTLPNIYTTGGSGTPVAIKVPLKNVKKITYPVFKSSSELGSFIFDENDVVLWMHTETTAETGTEKTIIVPPSASYMLLSIIGALYPLNWSVTTESRSLKDIDRVEEDVDLLYGKTVTKAQAIAKYQKSHVGEVYYTSGIVIGTTTEPNAPTYRAGSDQVFVLKVPLDNVKSISYPTFMSSTRGGSIICDENDVIIWAYSESQKATGTNNLINVPDGASYMMLQLSASLNALNWEVILYAIKQITEDIQTPFADENRNMCLAGIKTDILDNKIPYHRGFLFHKLQNNDGSLWYGTNFRDIKQIGTVPFNPTLMRFAISPKDGRVVAVERDTRNGIWIWDGNETTHLTGFTSDPQAWLYNSGVDFIKDGGGNEYCVFAEYSSSVVSGYTLNVWRGKYPYTSKSDWSVVMSKNQVADITHFHMVRRDPWTNVLYLTAGDSSPKSKWWYSTDYGANWTLLVSGTDTGWGNSTCRTINFIFTEEYIYWATDHGASEHALFRIARDSDTGIIDPSTKEKLCDLPNLYATNSLCYVESPRGLFMYDRIDTESSSIFGEDITMKFYDLVKNELVDVVTIGFTTATWGGSRGKCYVNYTNGKEVMPAMGFSIDTPCIFNLVCDNPSNIGTIAYDIGSKTLHTVNY